jgi:hypothetical protein
MIIDISLRETYYHLNNIYKNELLKLNANCEIVIGIKLKAYLQPV